MSEWTAGWISGWVDDGWINGWMAKCLKLGGYMKDWRLLGEADG